MASPDMQEAAHTFYANQLTTCVISTLGLSEKDVLSYPCQLKVEAVSALLAR